MPKNKKERKVYALITVLITVPCFVIYCMSIENGGLLNIDPKKFIIFTLLEIIIAFNIAYFIGSPLAIKLAFKIIDPRKVNKKIIQTTIVISTVCIMCPLMSFIATILYQGIFPGLVYQNSSFQISKFFINFIPILLKTIIQNFPFALITQHFLIQPFTRKIFSLAYNK